MIGKGAGCVDDGGVGWVGGRRARGEGGNVGIEDRR